MRREKSSAVKMIMVRRCENLSIAIEIVEIFSPSYNNSRLILCSRVITFAQLSATILHIVKLLRNIFEITNVEIA